MKILLFLFFATTFNYTNNDPISEVRRVFQKAATEEISCRYLVKKLDGYTELNNPLMAGYKACATMMMAKYVLNPFSKLSYFNKGKILLEKCINTEKENIELRFLRFSAQTKTPFFLGYKYALKEDRDLLMNALVNLEDNYLKQMILNFLKNEGSEI